MLTNCGNGGKAGKAAMNFFERRPAALAAGISLLLAFFAAFCGSIGRLALIIGAVVISIAAALFFYSHPGKRIATLGAFQFALLAGGMSILPLLTTTAFYDLSLARFGNISGEAALCADIINAGYESAWYACYDVKAETIDGSRSFAKGILLCESSPGLSVGDRIECTVEFVPLDEVFADCGRDSYDLISSGYTFACRASGDISRIDSSQMISPNRLAVMLAELRREVGAALELFCDSDTAALVKALFLADRSGLGILRRDMLRIGAWHLLALSGLHLAVITAQLDRLLLIFGMSRRLRKVFEIIAAAAFLALAGFPYSLTRAAVMLALLTLFRSLGRDRDMITALFLTGYLIALADPAALVDVGFHMSLAATLGVILISNSSRRLRERLGQLGKSMRWILILRYILLGAAVSLGAIMFVMPIQWIVFGETSLLAVPAALILSPLIFLMLQLILPYAVFACACTGLSSAALGFLAGRLGFLLTLLASLIRKLSSLMSQTRALVSLRYPFALPVILLTAAALVIMIKYAGSGWMKALVLFGVSAAVYLGSVGVYNAVKARENELFFASDGGSDAAFLRSGNACMMIDISSGSTSFMRKAADKLAGNRVTELDTCMLTHLHRSHAGALRTLCENRLVRRFLLPEPVCESDALYIEDITELAAKLGVRVEFYSRPESVSVSFGNAKIAVGEVLYLSRSVHPLIRLDFDLGEETVTYAGAALWESGQELSGTVVIGTHGPKIKSAPELKAGDSFDIASEELRFTEKP